MKTAKKVYELCFMTKNDYQFRNLLYSSKKRAMEDRDNCYFIGAMHPDGEIINSFVLERILF